MALLFTALLCALSSVHVFAAELTFCNENGGFPLSDQQLELVGETHKTVGSPPSDAQIVTAVDQQYCPGKLQISQKIYDPRLLPDDGSVWRAGSKRWSLDDEKAFSDWVAIEVDDEFFVRYQIKTDCADAALAIRVIFARIHHLPVAVSVGKGFLAHTEGKFAKLSTVRNWDETNWKDALKTDRRFHAFLDELKTKVGTENLSQSTYPVKLSSCVAPGKLSEFVSPGTVLLTGEHTRFISEIDSLSPKEPIVVMNSTVPAKVRPLSKHGIDLYYWPSEVGRGVLRWQWPVNCGRGFQLVPGSKMPGYSLEQYTSKNEDIDSYMQSLAPGQRGKANQAYVDKKLKELQRKLNRRRELVQGAQKELSANPGVFSDPHSAAYENFSTPHLDSGMKKDFKNFLDDLEDKALRDQVVARLKTSVIPIANGKYMTYAEYFQALNVYRTSSDPKASPEERWGYSYLNTLAANYRKNIRTNQEKITLLKTDAQVEYGKLSWYDQLRYKTGYLTLPSEQKILNLETESYINQVKIDLLRKRGVSIP